MLIVMLMPLVSTGAERAEGAPPHALTPNIRENQMSKLKILTMELVPEKRHSSIIMFHYS